MVARLYTSNVLQLLLSFIPLLIPSRQLDEPSYREKREKIRCTEGDINLITSGFCIDSLSLSSDGKGGGRLNVSIYFKNYFNSQNEEFPGVSKGIWSRGPSPVNSEIWLFWFSGKK